MAVSVPEFLARDLAGVGLTDTGFCDTMRQRQREVPHEIPNWSMGGRGLSRCERVGGLFLSEKQRPSDRAAGVHSYSANLPCCDCRLVLPRELLFGSHCKRSHICTGRPGGGSLAAAIEPLRLIQCNWRHKSGVTQRRPMLIFPFVEHCAGSLFELVFKGSSPFYGLTQCSAPFVG